MSESFFNQDEALILNQYLGLSTQSFFELLGVTSEATPSELKKAFHQKAKLFHPDRYRGRLRPTIHQLCQALFAVLMRAYETVSDEASKAQYMKEVLPHMDTDSDNGMMETHQDRGHYALAISLKAEEYLCLGQLDEAFLFYKKALLTVPEEPRYKMLVAWLRGQQLGKLSEKQAKELKDLIAACLKQRPDFAIAYLLQGIIMVEEGQLNAGIDWFQKALRIDPKHDKATLALQLTLEKHHQNQEFKTKLSTLVFKEPA